MRLINLQKLKKECFLVTIVPLALFILWQLTVQSSYFLWLAACGVGIAFIVCWGLFRFFNLLENLTWGQQLHSIIGQVNAPVLVMDQSQEITYASERFQALPFAYLIKRFTNLPQILASQHEANTKDRLEHIAHYADLINKITEKTKIEFKWNNKEYEWVVVGLYAPSGKRFGTLLECGQEKDL